MFNIAQGSVIKDMTIRLESICSQCADFSVLRSSKEMTIDGIQEETAVLVQQYPNDPVDEFYCKV